MRHAHGRTLSGKSGANRPPPPIPVAVGAGASYAVGVVSVNPQLPKCRRVVR